MTRRTDRNKAEKGRKERQIEETLRESAQRLRIMADFAYDWEYWRSPDNRFLYVSPSCERITGYANDEFIRDPDLHLRIVHPDDRERIAAHMNEGLNNRDKHELEFRIVRRDGRERWIAHVCRPVIDADGAFKGRRASNRDITDRKRAEEALYQLNAELERRVAEQTAEIRHQHSVLETEHKLLLNALETLPIYVILLAEDYSVPFANRFFRERFGESRGKRCFEYLFNRTQPCETCETFKVLKTGAPHHWEWLGPDGRNYDVYDYPFSDVDGSSLVLEMGIDVTEIRAVQKSLEASNTLLERIFDDTHLGIAYLDPSFNFIRTNRTYAGMVQKDADFFTGKNHFDLYPNPENEAIFRRVAETGEAFEVFEKPFEYPDQPERGTTWWDWSLQPVKDKDGRVEGLLLCLLDVTRRVLARKDLVASERKYRELVENANSIIMRITPNQEITFFNEYAQQFFGYAEEEVLGRNVFGTILPEVDSEGRDLRGMMREVTAHPEMHASNENENIRKDGQRVWVHWAIRAVRDEKGNIVEILCVGTDITRRREMEAEARRYQQRLRDLAKRLTTVEEEERWRISRYIHDTIVQNLSLCNIRLGSMARPRAEGNPANETDKLSQARKLIEQAIRECRIVMSDLTPALLYELGLVPALQDLAKQLEAKHGTRIFVEDDGQDKPLSSTLRVLLFDCVRELIMNALKHAGPCEIRVVAGCSGGTLTIRVLDNGKGFDSTASMPHPDRDSGFGLFNIRRRLEDIGGRLDIESAPGNGTTATIEMPIGKNQDI